MAPINGITSHNTGLLAIAICITLSLIPTAAQQRGAQSNAGTPPNRSSEPPVPTPPEVRQAQQQQPAEQQREPKTEISVTGGQSVVVQVNSPTAQPQTTAPPQNAQQRNPAPPINYSNWVVAIFTGGLLIVAVLQWLSYKAALATTKIIERAWISLETLRIHSGRVNEPYLVAGFKNSGRAPARILEANITVRGLNEDPGAGNSGNVLPEIPVYDTGDFVPPGILVAGEVSDMHYALPSTGAAFSLTMLTPGADVKLWVYGFVKYTNGLDTNVRSYGWIRRYDPVKSRREPRAVRFGHASERNYNYAD